MLHTNDKELIKIIIKLTKRLLHKYCYFLSNFDEFEKILETSNKKKIIEKKFK